MYLEVYVQIGVRIIGGRNDTHWINYTAADRWDCWCDRPIPLRLFLWRMPGFDHCWFHRCLHWCMAGWPTWTPGSVCNQHRRRVVSNHLGNHWVRHLVVDPWPVYQERPILLASLSPRNE